MMNHRNHRNHVKIKMRASQQNADNLVGNEIPEPSPQRAKQGEEKSQQNLTVPGPDLFFATFKQKSKQILQKNAGARAPPFAKRFSA